MKLYNLGKVPWHESQLIYHALAHKGDEALSLVSPSSPYVCIGFHQDLEQEVDLDFCKAADIPVFRRDLGGGAVYLDGNQLFFQLILKKDNPVVPKRKEAFYRKFLQPVIQVYRKIGIQAEYKPVNDVIAGNRKISGTGVGEIGECVVFVGNLIRDFNYDMMARILKVPDEKFRDKLFKTLEDNVSTIRRELGPEEAEKWPEALLNRMMAEAFQGLVGPMDPAGKDESLQTGMDALGARMMTDDWLYQKARKVPGRSVKIRDGVHVFHRMHKAPGGLIRADFQIEDGHFRNVRLSGDFFCYPEEAISELETALEGQKTENLQNLLEAFYEQMDVDIPGIEINDWRHVLS